MGLSVDALSVTLNGRQALRDVTVAFAPGRVTAVLGPNGAGKSSLLRAVCGLVRPSGGCVTLDGDDLAAMRPIERARAFGYLPQDAVVHWNMSVRDVVALGRLPHGGGGADAVAAALSASDTVALADRPVRTLSGGERARVLLARVLAGEPRWLLADEPLASLDPLHQLQTLALLRAAARDGMGVVVVLHDLTLAARVADDIVLLKDGTVLASGVAPTVLTEANLVKAYDIGVSIVGHGAHRALVPLTPA